MNTTKDNEQFDYSKVSILIVEDDEGLNYLIQRKLNKIGYKTEGVFFGREAITKISNSNYSLVLLDYYLTDIDAKELIEKLHGMGKDVPFVILTGQGNEKMAVQMLKLGAKDFLVKQGNFIELLPSTIESLLKTIGIEHELVETQLQLKTSEIMFHKLFELSPLPHLIIRAIDGVIINVNTAYLNATLYGTNEFIGKKYSELNLWTEQTKKQLQEHFEKNNNIENLEISYFNKQKEERFGLLSFNCLTDNEKEYYVGIIFDITERKKAEESVKESEKQLQLIIDNIPIVIGYIDENLTYQFVNQQLSDWFGRAKKDIIGKSVKEIMGENSFRYIFPKIERVFSGETVAYERIWSNSNTEKRITSILLIPHFDNLGKVKAYFLLQQDITNKKVVEQELIHAKEKAEESDRLKSAFLANMSHEIRTPMNGIIGFAALLDRDNLDSEKRKYYVDIINMSAKQLLTLVTDIIDISKIEAGQMNVVKIPCNINKVLNDIFSIFETEKIEKEKSILKISVCSALSEEKAEILTDESRLVQILSNLVSNALKFTEQGSVEIGYNLHESNTLLFWVKDTGIGIPLDKQKIIFERFRQVDDGLSRSYGGTGLGLAICKGLIDLLGGKIWVQSEKDKGATFYFTIPYLPTKKITLESTIETSVEIFDWTEKTILVVEDSDINFWVLEEQLIDAKPIIIRAENGIEAIEVCKTQKIDIVLMDLQLPIMNGFTATQLIKEIKPQLPIIAQTAYALVGDKEKAIKIGCDDYITKPIDSEELLRKINQYLIKN